MVATTQVPIVTNDWTDLGPGPMLMQPEGANEYLYAISDLKPVNIHGFVTYDQEPKSVVTTSHVWALAIAGGFNMTVAPITSESL